MLRRSNRAVNLPFFITRQRPGVAVGSGAAKKIPEFPAVGDQIEKATPIIQHNRPAQET
jgi:hypothetical protein